MKSVLAAAEFDLRTAAPAVAEDLTSQVTVLLRRAQGAGAARRDATADDALASVAGALAALRHAGADTDPQRSARIIRIVLDGLRPSAPG